MSIQIDTVRVAGLRGIKNLEITLPRVTVLIGPNNAGKTSLLKALQLALGDYSRYVSEEDFHIGSDDKKVNEIIVDVKIIPVNDKGERTQNFDDEWAAVFSDNIQKESNNQYIAISTRTKENLTKGGFETKRYALKEWPNSVKWHELKVREKDLHPRFEGIAFYSIDAQRDIHQELKEKSSFVGQILSNIEYGQGDIDSIEALIKNLNDSAVEKSSELKELKGHLENLNQSFQGSGNAEITPFPKKIRDLSKHFTVHFGESSSSSFSMEYHGMGTRSWASLLAVKALINLSSERHKNEEKPFFPILAAEEPEAHLHPNAQRTLYHQLANSSGQLIVSTHSPYLAAAAKCTDLIYLKRSVDGVRSFRLSGSLAPEDQRRIEREVIHSRGEILFSKAIVLCEGETEEQALPLIFAKYFENDSFALGVNFIGAGGSGKKYLPFFTFSKELDIPVFVFSDGETEAVKGLKRYYNAVFGITDISNCPRITILDGTDFEGYLMDSGFTHIIEEAITELDGVTSIQEYKNNKQGSSSGREKSNAPRCITCNQEIYQDVIRDFNTTDGHKKALLEILDKSKPKYAPVIARKLCELDTAQLPPKIIEFFEKIKAGSV